MAPDSSARNIGRNDPSTVRTAIIVLTLDQRDTTLRLLKTLNKGLGADTRVLLWDNGSSDDTLASIRSQFPEVRAHRSDENLGVAKGRNRAAKLAICEWDPEFLLFLDNDMTVDPGFLAPLLTPLIEVAGVAQTTAKIRDLDDPERIYGAGGCRVRFWWGDTRHVGSGQLDQGQFDHGGDCVPSGGCMLVRANAFTSLDGFDETFSPYGPEDLDFGLRARAAGYRAIYVPESIVYHQSKPGRTFESGRYSETYATHRSRHWFLFMHRHASLTQRLGFYFIGAPYRLLVLALREARRGNLLPALRGLIQGARGQSGD